MKKATARTTAHDQEDVDELEEHELPHDQTIFGISYVHRSFRPTSIPAQSLTDGDKQMQSAAIIFRANQSAIGRDEKYCSESGGSVGEQTDICRSLPDTI